MLVVNSVNIDNVALIRTQDCKGMFDDLANTVRTVLASRNEILEYDRRQRVAVGGHDSFKVGGRLSLSWPNLN